MKKEKGTVRHTAETLKACRARGEDKTDWARADAMSEAELEAAIASDPDEAGMVIDWSKAAVVTLPPPKETMTIRVDADVLAYFRKMGRGYQTRMNAVLRSFMEHSEH